MKKNMHHTAVRHDETYLFYFAATTLVTVFFAYIYFVSISVAHVVIRKEIDEQIASLSTTVSQLEASYIDIQHLVSAEIATHSGYIAVAEKVFIDKDNSDTLVLNQN